MTMMKVKVATRIAAHDRMNNMWVLSDINRKKHMSHVSELMLFCCESYCWLKLRILNFSQI